MSWTRERERWEAVARSIDPAIRLVPKGESRLMRLYARLPWLGREFLERTSTALGPLVFVPASADVEHDLFHEGRHVRQMRWFGLGIHPWVGLVPFAVAAVLLLPLGFTVRFWLELDAEAFALRRKMRTGSKASYVAHELEEFAGRLAGPGYAWAWLPSSWARRIGRRRAISVIAGEVKRA